MHVNDRQTDLSAIRDISFDPAWAKAYEAHYVQIDPRLETARRLYDRHPIMTDDILCSYHDYRSSAFYRPNTRPLGYLREAFGLWRLPMKTTFGRC